MKVYAGLCDYGVGWELNETLRWVTKQNLKTMPCSSRISNTRATVQFEAEMVNTLSILNCPCNYMISDTLLYSFEQ